MAPHEKSRMVYRMSQPDPLEELKKAVVRGDPNEAVSWAKKAVESEMNPVEALEKGLGDGLRSVGDSFGRGEVFLCDLVLSAEAMKQASAILEEEIRKRGLAKRTVATLVIGTVAGDIHDIGKTIVAALLSAAGFNVIDLGTDVPVTRFLSEVDEHTPDILGLSALLTVTALEQAKVIEALKTHDLRSGIKVIVGGGAVTEEHAEEIGADGYGEDAEQAVAVAKELLKIP